MMKQTSVYALLFLILLMSRDALTQNLVPNGDFEDFSVCPSGYNPGFGDLGATGWISPTGGSSDYFNACSMGVVDVPMNAFGNQPAHSGVAYAGSLHLYAMLNSYREYIQVQLTEPLIAGISYNVGLYYALGELTCSTDRLGIHLSDTQITNPGLVGPLSYIPQIELAYPVENTDWELFSTCYVAEGGEEWLTIGSFYPDSLVTHGQDCPLWGGTIISYIFIDDVFVEEGVSSDTIQFSLGPDLILCDSVLIETPFDQGEFEWQDGTSDPVYVATEEGYYSVTVSTGCGTGIDSIEVFEALPPIALFEYVVSGNTVDFTNLSSNGHNATWDFGDGSLSEEWAPSHVYSEGGDYTLQLIVYGYCSNDTLTQVIHVSGVGTKDLEWKESVIVFPNPNLGHFTVKFQNTKESYDLEVFDMIGRSMMYETLEPSPSGTHTFSLDPGVEGLYTVVIRRMEFRHVLKMVIMK